MRVGDTTLDGMRLLSLSNNSSSTGCPSSNSSCSLLCRLRPTSCVSQAAVAAAAHLLTGRWGFLIKSLTSHISTGQDLLESSYPSTTPVPSKEAISSASRSNEKELDREARDGKLVEERLSVPNTIIKFILDQSIGAAINTVAFSLFTHSIQQAMSHRTTGPDESAAFLVSGWGMSGGPMDYSQVNWKLVLEEAKSEFLPIMKAGWALWPWVSLFNFAVVKSIEVRSLIGAIAGMVWGVYTSLISAR